jgi:hypothetical protein
VAATAISFETQVPTEQLPLRDRSGDPGPIQSMEALRRSAGWDQAIAAGASVLTP